MEEETKISLEEIEKRIDSYVDRGDWLELKDFLQTQQFEELIEKNTEFQEIILSKLKNLLRIIGWGDNEKDWFKSLLNLLFLSDNTDQLNKLFLRVCKMGHLDIVESFFEPSRDDKININYKDPEGKTCFHYAADGKGDNYDVVDLLLKKDKKSDKASRTKALFYFLNKESESSTKVKSVEEIIKRIDKIDLNYTDEKGKGSAQFPFLNPSW